MAEYIERDRKKIIRLIREAQHFQDDIVCAVGTDFMQKIAEAENKMIFDILKGLENELAADVVEVVRCKDCKWWEARSFGALVGRCQNPINGLFNEYSDDEDFCSYGERKEQK